MSAEEAHAQAPVEEKKEETKTEEIPPKQPRKINRAEKKMRDALLKHNLKELENVTTVTMRAGNQMVFSFSQPDVFYLDNVYIVFGENNRSDAASAASQSISDAAGKAAEQAPVVVENEDEEAPDATGLDENDIKMVMQQANVSRAKAIKALRDNNNDMVTAVMNLTV